MILGDKKSNGPQFSKLTTIVCILIAIISFVAAPCLCIFFGLSETVAAAIIAAGGTIGATAMVWNLKKSQAENTTKIYLSAYREIAEIKRENNEDVEEFLIDAENNIVNKLNNTIDMSLDEATSSIETQNIM